MDVSELPPEILERILQLVSLDDQVQCLQVCRGWEEVVQGLLPPLLKHPGVFFTHLNL